MKFVDKMGNSIECTVEEYLTIITPQEISTPKQSYIEQSSGISSNTVDIKALAIKVLEQSKSNQSETNEKAIIKQYPRLRKNPFVRKKSFCIRRVLFALIKEHTIKHNKLPTTGWLQADAQNIVNSIREEISQAGYKSDSGFKIYQWLLKYIKEDKELHDN